jgi:hypothetical protein
MYKLFRLRNLIINKLIINELLINYSGQKLIMYVQIIQVN